MIDEKFAFTNASTKHEDIVTHKLLFLGINCLMLLLQPFSHKLAVSAFRSVKFLCKSGNVFILF